MNLVNRDTFFGSLFDELGDVRRSSGVVRSDVYERDGNYVIEADVPGFKKENVKIDYNEGYIRISGKKEEVVEENTNYLHRERSYGEFSRSYYVGNIDDSKVKAKFEDGTLKVTFPKEDPEQSTKQIPIE